MIHLAYDGSINSDWVAWYALNLALHDPERRLRVIYIDTAGFEEADVRASRLPNKTKPPLPMEATVGS